MLEPFLHPRSLPVLKVPGGSRSGGVLPAADAAPRNAFSSDPWQEAEAWLGYGAGFRHGLEQCEPAPEEPEKAAEECEKDPEGREPAAQQLKSEPKPGANLHQEGGDGGFGGLSTAAPENRRRDAAAEAEQARPTADVAMSEAWEHADVITREATKGPGSERSDVNPREAGTASVEGVGHVFRNEVRGGFETGNGAGNGASGTKRLREAEAVERGVGKGHADGDARRESEPAAKKAPTSLRPEDLPVPVAKGKAKLAADAGLDGSTEREREAALAAEAARNVFGLLPRKGGDADSDSEGSLPAIVDGDPDDDDFM